MDKLNDFKAELKELLTKYRASIGCNVDGDTHGLLYEMVVNFGGVDGWKDHKLSNTNEVEANDL